MTRPLHWGILTTGNIARQFTEALAGAQRGRAVAVGSRSGESAKQFADTYNIERAYGSYEDLLADSAVDAIYNALPNSMHHEWTIKALEAGKHVLCEKPLARDAAESEHMFDVARKHGLMLVEAFMYRSHPVTLAVMEQVQGGGIGELGLIRTNFSFCARKIEGNVRFDRSLAGGALMDVGCYCVNFSRYLAGGEPTRIHAVGRMRRTGVDAITSATLQFPTGVIANFTCGLTVHADNTALLCGSDGYIEVPVPWKPPQDGASYVIKGARPPRQDSPASYDAPQPQTFQYDAGKPIFALEADDFAACCLDAAPPRITRADTIGNMKVLDEIRRQIGLEFEKEK